MISLYLRNRNTPVRSGILTEEELIWVVKSHSGEKIRTLEDSLRWINSEEGSSLEVQPATYEQLGKSHPGKTIGFCTGYIQFVSKLEAIQEKLKQENIDNTTEEALKVLKKIRDRVPLGEAVCLVRSRGSYCLHYIIEVNYVGQKDKVLFIRAKTYCIVVVNTKDSTSSRTNIGVYSLENRRIYLDDTLTLSTIEHYNKLQAIANTLEDSLINQ